MKSKHSGYNRLITRYLSLLIFAMLIIPVIFATNSSQAADGPPPYPAPPLEPGSLTDEETELMKHALSTIFMDWDDMGFKKDYIDDPFRLSVVQDALDDPPSLVKWNYDWDAFLLEPKPGQDIIKKASYDLDSSNLFPVITGSNLSKSIGAPEYNIFKNRASIIQSMDSAVYYTAQRMRKDVLGSLSDKEVDFLRTYLLCRFDWKEEEDLDCPEEEEYGASQEFLDIMEHFDLASLLLLSYYITGFMDAFITQLPDIPDYLKPDERFIHRGDSGNIVIGTMGDDIWYMDEYESLSILIDPGGNDIYHGGVAVAGSLKGEDNPLVSVIIDLSGDDMYLANDERSNGSGILGIALQYDLAGNDTYRAHKFSQGCGIFGVGILEDRDGEDIYKCDFMGQGAGAIGLGLLKDDAGRDNYHAAFYAQGFGYTRGWGMLTDRDGYDTYYAGGKYDAWPTWGGHILSCSQGYSFGIRPVASGGVGIIHDRNGNDYYSAEVFSQGGSYWYGLGSMIDDNGDDQYIAQVYSQGAGVHLSTGIVLDRAGNDNYSCDAAAQGFAHDLSVGWLIDEAGNDNYSSKNSSQGWARTNSFAGLIDRAGNDGYMCQSNKREIGYGYTTRNYGNIGVQLDMMGSDVYTYSFASDGAWWSTESWLVGIDVGDDWWDIEKDEEGNEISRKLLIPGVKE